MAQLLLSFCYSRPLGYALARYDTESEALEWIDLGATPFPVHGATGICLTEQGFYAALHLSQGTMLADFDMDCRLRRVGVLPQILDAHSIVIWKGAPLIVGTGTNQVFSVDWPSGQEPAARVFFELADTLHMNSLQVFDGHLYLSMFGRKSAGELSWKSARDGKIVKLSEDSQVVASGIYHPHGMFVDRDTLCSLDSMNGAIVPIDGAIADRYPPLLGYIRGAACDAENIYVGVSIPRAFSKSRGCAETAAQPTGCGTNGCGLHLIERASRQTKWLDLSPFGAVWPGTTPISCPREQAMVSRLHAMNLESASLSATWTRLQDERKTIIEAINDLIAVDHDYRAAGRILERLSTGADPDFPESKLLHTLRQLCQLAMANERTAA